MDNNVEEKILSDNKSYEEKFEEIKQKIECEMKKMVNNRKAVTSRVRENFGGKMNNTKKSSLELSEEIDDFLEYGNSIKSTISLYLEILRTSTICNLDYNDTKIVTALKESCLERILKDNTNE